MFKREEDKFQKQAALGLPCRKAAKLGNQGEGWVVRMSVVTLVMLLALLCQFWVQAGTNDGLPSCAGSDLLISHIPVGLKEMLDLQQLFCCQTEQCYHRFPQPVLANCTILS